MNKNKAKGAIRPKQAREGFFGKFGYFWARALTNFKQNLFVSMVTVATITLALLLTSLFLLVYVNLQGMAEGWSEKVQITAYFDKEPTPLAAAALRTRVEAIPGTKKVRYVSQEEAVQRFRKRLKGQESLLEGITADVLPSSFEITLDRDHRDGAELDRYVKALKKVAGIGEVQYGEEWVKRFNTFMNFVRIVGAVLGTFLALAVLFIVSNTIKLTVYARKEELEVLGLVGATRFFMKAPFLIEGVLQGALGAVLSLALLTGCYYLFLNNAGNFLSVNPAAYGILFLPPAYLAAIFGGGVFLGFFGSLASLRRFITI
ncbi:permease-like cell division protein FtsX [Geomesophilobacter sediminis]|uniref:Cell division protein FtsX n=1 Tax=Geomesophilobacter sediminis TaxID=2798584 RepID=A0A8J7JEX7_9BACT|nr:permease-like cell division protein FtsX [Geomesophilobacter sediminis]MBJ6726338.1 ABC transporter permease [Geomesophilobacter sediminis]